MKTWKLSWSRSFPNRPQLYHRIFKWKDRTLWVTREFDGWWSIDLTRADDYEKDRIPPHGYGKTRKEAFADFRLELEKEIK